MSLDVLAGAVDAPATPAPAPDLATVAANSAPAEGASLHDVQMEAAKALLRELPGNENKAELNLKGERDPSTGKFTKSGTPAPAKLDAKLPNGATGDPSDAQSEDGTKSETDAQPSSPPPAHLAPDIKAVWSKLPAEAQDAIAARTLDDRKAISRLGNEVKRYEPFVEVANQHREYFERNQAHPASVFNNLMAWNQVLESDPVAHFPKLIETYGVKPAEVQAMITALARQHGLSVSPTQADDDFSLPPDQNTVALRAEIESIKRQNAQLMNRLGQNEGTVRQFTQTQQAEAEARAEYARAQEESRMSSSVDSFVATVDKNEFEFLRPYVAAEILKLDPNLPEKDVMPTAYANARKALEAVIAPRLSQTDKAKQQQAQQASNGKARQIASSNVRGLPPVTPPIASVKDAQNDVLRKYGLAN